jgi:hypothetical protein
LPDFMRAQQLYQAFFAREAPAGGEEGEGEGGHE